MILYVPRWEIRRQTGQIIQTSSFLLCLLSDVWKRELCGYFHEKDTKQIVLCDVEPATFAMLLHLACCTPPAVVPSFSDLVDLALLADRFALDPLRVVLEKEAVRRLTLEDCPAILDLHAATASGLSCLPQAAVNLACDRFEVWHRM